MITLLYQTITNINITWIVLIFCLKRNFFLEWDFIWFLFIVKLRKEKIERMTKRKWVILNGSWRILFFHILVKPLSKYISASATELNPSKVSSQNQWWQELLYGVFHLIYFNPHFEYNFTCEYSFSHLHLYTHFYPVCRANHIK